MLATIVISQKFILCIICLMSTFIAVKGVSYHERKGDDFGAISFAVIALFFFIGFSILFFSFIYYSLK